MLAKCVTVSEAVQKVRVVLRQAWSKSQWTVLMEWNILLSQQMLDAVNTSQMTFFLPGRQHAGALCV